MGAGAMMWGEATSLHLVEPCCVKGRPGLVGSGAAGVRCPAREVAARLEGTLPLCPAPSAAALPPPRSRCARARCRMPSWRGRTRCATARSWRSRRPTTWRRWRARGSLRSQTRWADACGRRAGRQAGWAKALRGGGAAGVCSWSEQSLGALQRRKGAAGQQRSSCGTSCRGLCASLPSGRPGRLPAGTPPHPCLFPAGRILPAA